MCWKSKLRTVGILGALTLSPFTLSADGPGAATVCARAADNCKQETDSICLQADGALSLDNVLRMP